MHPHDTKDTQTTTQVSTELMDAVKLVMQRLSDRQHVIVTDRLLYRSENMWHIDDLEQQPLVTVPDVKEAAIYFVLMNTPEVIQDVLGDEIVITAELPPSGEVEINVEF